MTENTTAVGFEDEFVAYSGQAFKSMDAGITYVY